jgi:hypothetical protein
LTELGVDGVIILEWVLKEQAVRMWTQLNVLRTGSIGHRCEHDSEPQEFIKIEEFLDQL